MSCICKEVVLQVTEIMHYCRDAAKCAFCFDIGYSFFDNEYPGNDICKYRVKLKWGRGGTIGYKTTLARTDDVPINMEVPSFEIMRIPSNTDTVEKKKPWDSWPIEKRSSRACTDCRAWSQYDTVQTICRRDAFDATEDSSQRSITHRCCFQLDLFIWYNEICHIARSYYFV